MISKHKKLATFFTFVIAIFGMVAMGNVKVYARTVTNVQESILNKAVYQGVYKCYTNNHIVDKIDPLTDYKGIGSLLNKSNADEGFVPLVTGVGSSSIMNTYRYSIKDSWVSCKELLEGGR